MPAIYDLVNDYDSPDCVISMAPIWVLGVIRWTHPFVFDRTKLSTSKNIDAFEQVQSPTIIVSSCSSLDISASKSSHISNLTATLRDDSVNYLSAIFPDDWLFAWILPNETRAKDLIRRIRQGDACNGFADGLKFLGRVQSIFKDTIVDDAGRPMSIFNLSGVGFSEFDYTIFWEPTLAVLDSLPVWYQRVGVTFNKIITGSDTSVTQDKDSNAIDVNKMIPTLARLTLGEGPFKGGNLSVPGGANASPNGGIRIPSLVGSLLGMVNVEKINYSDIVDIVVGVQKYKGAAGAAQNSPDIFTPDGLVNTSTVVGEGTNAAYLKTGIDLLGEFPIVQLPFQDTPIWQIFNQFLNPAVNEMYVALKPDSMGDVFPRLTIRQLPFSTRKFEFYSKSSQSPAVTTFLELPRWRIDPKMLKRIQVGRSNVLRSNFWHVQGVGPGTPISPQMQYIRSPPLTDKQDIERSGLRRITRTVNCLIKDAALGPYLWRNIITDITAGQHLTLTGTIITTGIVSPVAPGDNIQFANVVYHVESISHVCIINDRGMRSWQTNLQVSHGLADEVTLEQNQQDTELDTTLQEYAGVRNADSVSVYVGNTVLDDFEKEF